jgi:hypothetical protein
VASAALAVVVGLTLTGCQSGAAGSVGVATSGAPGNVTAGRGQAALPDTLPRYYAETTAAHQPAYASPDDITIRDTGTAAVAATVRPPHPFQTFGYVFAAGSPDTWVAAAQPWHPGKLDDGAQPWYSAKLDNSAQPATLFTLTFDPATRRVALTKLPAPPTAGDNVVAAGLSRDGTRFAEVVLVPGRPVVRGNVTWWPATAWLRSYSLADGAVVSAARELATAADRSAVSSYTLTWLDDSRSVAIGGVFGSVGGNVPADAVQYVDASSAGTLAVSRTVRLVFPPAGRATFDAATAAPQQCTGAPVATSDGQTITCGGTANTAMNEGGYANVGIWAFSVLTGRLTGSWGRHSIMGGGNLPTAYPRVIWVSPTGRLAVATGLGWANQGANLYLRTADGRLRQIPWRGLFQYPGIYNIIEPPIAW